MNEKTQLPSQLRLERLKRLTGFLKRGIFFIGGILAAFLGLVLYNLFFPATPPISVGQVSTIAAQVMASATPKPSFSDQVYQIIKPSLVAIQTQGTAPGGTADSGLGTGVIIDDKGDILTCLHVIANATAIQLTFADGTESNATVSPTAAPG